jgi:ribosomal protein L25 (general stress protein Ctc)
VHHLLNKSARASVIALCIIIGACAPTKSTKTYDSTNETPYKAQNILVIAIAPDYDSRARFERNLASELRKSGVSAAAYYSVGGGNTPIDSDSIAQLVASDGFDTVLITRVMDSNANVKVKKGSARAQAIRMQGGGVNLFRYDYETLNDPMTLHINLDVAMSTEVFSIASDNKVWSIQLEFSRMKTIDALISKSIESIVRQLKKDRIIGS